MGSNCYSVCKPEESKGVDIIEKVQQFLYSNNFYFFTASKIYNYGQSALHIQSDEDLEDFLYNIIDQKEILRLQVITIKKIMHLMNFSVRINSISDEDLPILIVEILFLTLANPERPDIQKEKLSILVLLLNTERNDLEILKTKELKDRKVNINTRKFTNNIRLFINIIYIILVSYILLIVFLPNGAEGLEVYFENQDKHGLGIEDTIKWVYKIVETITNEGVDKDYIVDKCMAFVEEPIREVVAKNQKLFSSEEGVIALELEQFDKIANQLLFVSNPLSFFEFFFLSKGINKDTPGK